MGRAEETCPNGLMASHAKTSDSVQESSDTNDVLLTDREYSETLHEGDPAGAREV